MTEKYSRESSNWPCFLCLSPVALEPDNDWRELNPAQETPTDNGGHFCFKRIFNCLKFAPFENQSKSQISWTPQKEDFVVPLCRPCYITSKSLNESFEQLEIAKLKTLHSLNCFKNLIAVSPESDDSENKIRTRAKTHCARLLRNQQPHVTLKPLNSLKSTKENISANIDDTSNIKEKRKDPCHRPKSFAEISKVLLGAPNISLTTTDSQRQQPVVPIKRRKIQALKVEVSAQGIDSVQNLNEQANCKAPITVHDKPNSPTIIAKPDEDSKPGGVSKCQFCNKGFWKKETLARHTHSKKVGINFDHGLKGNSCTVCSKTFDSNWEALYHQVTSHADHYFLSLKPPLMCWVAFRQLCNETINAASSAFTKVVYPNEEKLGCLHCEFQIGEKLDYSEHLLLCHTNKLANDLNNRVRKKLKETVIIETIPATASTKKNLNTSKLPNTFCDLCNKRFPHKTCIRQNYFDFHIPAFLYKIKPECLSTEKFESICSNLIKEVVSKWTSKLFCNETFECSYCGKKFKEKSQAVSHLTIEHQKEYTEKLQSELKMHLDGSNEKYDDANCLEATKPFLTLDGKTLETLLDENLIKSEVDDEDEEDGYINMTEHTVVSEISNS